MLRRKIEKVGPFVCFRHIGDKKGDFQYSDTNEVLLTTENIPFYGEFEFESDGKVQIFNNGEYDRNRIKSLRIAHLYTKGSFRCLEFENDVDKDKPRIDVIRKRGDGGWKVTTVDSTIRMIALEDNSEYRCYYPWNDLGFRWSRCVGLSRRDDILQIPRKSNTQFLILAEGSVEINGETHSHHKALKINANERRDARVTSDELLWLRMWPDVRGKNEE